MKYFRRWFRKALHNIKASVILLYGDHRKFIMRFELFFSGGSSPELLRTRFTDEHKHVHESVRGKTEGAFAQGVGTFQWSRSVHALAIFWVRVAVRHLRGLGEGSISILEGERGSAAASLEFAIAKPPRWLAEMFGWDRSGSETIRHIVRRSNPELKRPGPVTLAPSQRWIRSGTVLVSVGDSLVATESALTELLNALETSWTPLVSVENVASNSKPASSHVPKPFQAATVRDELKALWTKNASDMLRAVDIFSSRGVEAIREELRNDASLLRIADSLEPFEALLRKPSVTERLGVGQPDDAIRTRPLRVSVPIPLNGSAALFERLKSAHDWNLEIDNEYPHAVDLLKKISEGSGTPPDLCVLGIAPAAMLLNLPRCRDFLPVMFMPPISHEVLAAPSAEKKSLQNDHGEYRVVDEPPSTSAFYFDDLRGKGAISRRRSRIVPSEVDEASVALRSGDADVRAVMFFPYYEVTRRFQHARVMPPAPEISLKNTRLSVLFAHRSLVSDQRCLTSVERGVRNVWLELRSIPSTQHQATAPLLDDPRYLQLLHRFSDLCHSESEVTV